VLQVTGLSGGYPPVSVFRDVDLTVGEDEAVGLFGPNGHGKSTLLSTVAGLLDPWRGEIRFDGRRLNAPGDMPARLSRHVNYDLFRPRRMRARHAVRAGLIYVMQGNRLFPEMTVDEVLGIAPKAAMGRAGVGEMYDLAHDLFPVLRRRRRSKIRYLSGGERQMVSIAVALLAVPRLLILDEPTLGLAPRLRLELAEAVGRIREAGTPLVLVDQNIEFLTGLVDRLHLFVNGTIAAEIDRTERPSHESIMTLMFGGAAR